MASAARAHEILGIRHPIIQGPFGGGLSTAELASTVSNLGGLGSFGAHHLAPEKIGPLVREIGAQTSAPFAVNLWISDHDPGGLTPTPEEFDRYARSFATVFRELGLEMPSPAAQLTPRYEEQVEALLEARPPVFSFIFGIPSAVVLKACRERGIVTVGTATSVAEARALEAAGVAIIVATGFEAGGHRPSFLARAEDSLMGTFVLTQLVARRVNVPVVSAGGIADARGVRAALALGAQGVQVGTAFLACRESGATEEHRELLFSERAYHTVLTRAFSGRLARSLRNRWTDEIAPKLESIAPYPVQGWFMSQLRAAAVRARRTDVVSLWSSQIAPNLQHRTAADVFASLIEDERGSAAR
jgi:nitronate monooxygenase